MPEYTNNNLLGSIVKDLHTRKARLAKAKRRTAQEEVCEETSEVAGILDKAYDALSEADHDAACDALKELAHHLQVADEVSFDTETASGPDIDIAEEVEEEPSFESEEEEDESPMEEHDEE